MNTYVTSDTHWWHRNILGFPTCHKYRSDLYGDKEDQGSLESMNEGMISVWNRSVKPGDKVYHLGDFVIAYGKKVEPKTKDILSRLNGDIVLVMGNHDNETTRRVFKSFGHEVVDYKEIGFGGLKICMSHYAMVNWNKKHYGSIMLHGHEHGNLRSTEVLRGKTLDVGWDCWGRPISIEEVVSQLEDRESIGEGHHTKKD